MDHVSYISNSEFYVEVAKGNVEKHSLLAKFGRNGNVPNGSFAFLNVLGFTDWPLSAPTTVRIKAGGDANDTAAGTGAQKIGVEGIDSNFDEIREEIVTAGASASAPTTASFWRVHRCYVSEAGTYNGNNAGAVTIENSAGGTDLIQIIASTGQSQFGGYSTPRDRRGYFLGGGINVQGNQAADIALYIRENFDDTTAPMSAKRLLGFWDGVIGVLPIQIDGVLTSNHIYSGVTPPAGGIPPKSDLWFEAAGTTGNSQVSVIFQILMVQD